MIYWPTSLIAKDPTLHHSQVWELLCAEHASMSARTVEICSYVADRTPACRSFMILIHSDNAPMRRYYLEQPTSKDFEMLERGGFVASQNSFGFIVDALH